MAAPGADGRAIIDIDDDDPGAARKAAARTTFLEFYGGGGGGGGAPTFHGRGVIMATRGGDAVLLDTHPSDAPPSPPPPQPPKAPPCTMQGLSMAKAFPCSADGSVAGTGARDGNGSGNGGSGGGGTNAVAPPRARPTTRLGGFSTTSTRGVEEAVECPRVVATCSSSRKRARGDGMSASPADGDAFTCGGAEMPSCSTQTKNISDSGGSSAKEEEPRCPVPGPVLSGPLPQPAAAAVSTLGAMGKRGVLVRAARRFTCMSVVGVRLVKAATWCKNCGLVS